MKWKPNATLKGVLIFVVMICLASCSKSPEKAIEAMKKKADDYMIAGRKPTEEMIIADCSDFFAKDFKDDIGWMSKLKVFEPALLEHINNKQLFDTTKKFPKTTISAATLKTDNADSAYYYLHTEATFENVAYVNHNGENSSIVFLTKDNSGKFKQETNVYLTTDLSWEEIAKQKIIGCPFVRVFNRDAGADEEPWDYYFYDNKTNHFDAIEIPHLGGSQIGRGLFKAILQISKNDTSKKEITGTDMYGGQTMILNNSCANLYYRIANENGAGLINDEQAQQQIKEKFSENDYYVWEKSEDKRFFEPIGDILTITGTFELSEVKNAKVVKKEPGFNLTALKKVNFRNGKLL